MGRIIKTGKEGEKWRSVANELLEMAPDTENGRQVRSDMLALLHWMDQPGRLYSGKGETGILGLKMVYEGRMFNLYVKQPIKTQVL